MTLYRFRWLLYELVVRDLKLRYRGSVLGVAWTLLNPILFMVIYTLVFSVFMRSAIPNYPLFLLSGLIPWMWVSGAISQAVTSILDGRAYVGKTLMPSEVLVLVAVLSNGVNFMITIALLFPLAVAFGVNVGAALLFLPLLVAIELCFTVGLCLLVASLNVFFRDLQQVVNYVLTAAFFLTPIFYARTSVPDNMQAIVTCNPLASMLAAYQAVFYKGVAPSWSDLVFAGFSAILVFAAGVGYFNNTRDSLGEYV